MTDAVISDITGKQISKTSSYKVKVKNVSTGLTLSFDTERNDELFHLMSLAMDKGNCKWSTWNNEFRMYVPASEESQQKLD
jgi:hypothetical protein